MTDILNCLDAHIYETKWKDKNLSDLACATLVTIHMCVMELVNTAICLFMQESVSYTLPRTPLRERRKKI